LFAANVTWYVPSVRLLRVYVPLAAVVVGPQDDGPVQLTLAPEIGDPVIESVTVPVIDPGFGTMAKFSVGAAPVVTVSVCD
jgi:hypothetical protein